MIDLDTAELAVLGSILLTGGTALDDIDFTPSDYRSPAYEFAHRTMQDMKADGQPIDLLTVSSALSKAGERFDPTMLHRAQEATPSAASVEHYAGIVTDAATLRRLQAAAGKVQAMASEGGDADEIVEAARREMDAAQSRSRSTPVQFVADTIEGTIDALDEEVTSTPTLWEGVNDVITGLRPGALYVVGARPSVGKSVVALQLAQALLQKGSVAFVSLEMSTNDLTTRLLSNELRIGMDKLTTHNLDAQDWAKITDWVQNRRHVPLAINDNSGSSLTDIKKFARNVNRRKPLAGVIVDYLQLMSQPPGDKRPRHEFVADMSRQLKILAMDMQVPVIALSQLNRSSEAREDKRPGLHDLRESGAIEQDADVVILLHREIMGDKTDEITFSIAKNRHGRTAPVNLAFAGHWSMVRDARTWPHAA